MLLIMKLQVKTETRVPKVIRSSNGRLRKPDLSGFRSKRGNSFEKETELSSHGREKYATNVSLVSSLYDSQSRREKLSRQLETAGVTLQPGVPAGNSRNAIYFTSGEKEELYNGGCNSSPA